MKFAKTIKSLHKTLKLVTILVFLILNNSTAMAYSDFYQKNNRGWYWFEENRKPKENRVDTTNGSQTPHSSSLEELKEFQEELEGRKASMIMRPTIENTREFIKHQNEMFSKAGKVSQNMREVMLISPELNIAREIPISNEGVKIRKRAEKAKNIQLLNGLAKRFKLLFFYKSNCLFCKNFAPVIEVFAKRYGFKVASITLDGKNIEKFSARYDSALIEKFGVTQVPALFIYSEELKIAAPVMAGYGAIDELESNMFYVANKLSKSSQLQNDQSWHNQLRNNQRLSK